MISKIKEENRAKKMEQEKNRNTVIGRNKSARLEKEVYAPADQ